MFTYLFKKQKKAMERTPRFFPTRLLLVRYDFGMLLIVLIPIGLINLVAIHISLSLVYALMILTCLILGYKDFLSGQSFAKRYYGFQVVKVATGLPATELQCFVRNVVILFFPLDILVAVASPRRRLGDLLARTSLVEVEQTPPESLLIEFKSYQWNEKTISYLILSAIIIALLIIGTNFLLASIGNFFQLIPAPA